MIITGNIKLEQFRAEIVNPVVTVNQVNDNIQNQVCSVEIVMTVDGGSRLAHSLSGFDYSATGTWEDIDILNWVESEMYLLAGITKKATIKTDNKIENGRGEAKKKSLLKRFINWLKSLLK